MLITYITATEAGYYFKNHTDYSSDIRANALKASYGLVNSFINPKVKVPVVSAWDGQSDILAPELLKIAQGSFYRYILQSSNDGYNEELEALYTATAEKLRGIKDGELSIPSAQTYPHDAGWHVVEKNISASGGDLEVRGPYPLYKCFYDLIVSSGGYADSFTYTVKRDDSASVIATNSGTYENWTIVDDKFEIRFNGQFTTSDSFSIMGVPSEEIDSVVTDGPIFKQGPVAYGSSDRLAQSYGSKNTWRYYSC